MKKKSQKIKLKKQRKAKKQQELFANPSKLQKAKVEILYCQSAINAKLFNNLKKMRNLSR